MPQRTPFSSFSGVVNTTQSVVISPSSTTIPETIRGCSGQSVDLQQWQSSTPTVLAKVDATGNIIAPTLGLVNIVTGSVPLSITGAAGQTGDLQQWKSSTPTVLSSVDKAGRFGSANVETVSAVAGADAGSAPPAPIVSGSTDVRGLITWGTGTTAGAGAQVAVTFPTAWATAPYVVVTPINAATALLLPYVAAPTTTSFTISTQVAPADAQGNTVYGVQFHALG